MRIAALYDVHGNLPALEAVLAEVERERVDVVVCGGDLVSGPFPAGVYDRLAVQPGMRFLRGNADREVLARSEAHGAAWCAERLGPERLLALGRWPLSLALAVDGLGETLFCHATPRSDEEILTRVTPAPEVEAALGGTEARVVVCGHTHVQFDRLAGARRLVNAGSVGMPYEGRRGAYWALLGDDVQLRRTIYDVEQAAAAIRATAAPGAQELAGWLLDPPGPAEATAHFESLRGT